MTSETGFCSICGETYTHFGHNAMPINDGRCCDACNNQHVTPARIMALQNLKDDEDESNMPLMPREVRFALALKRFRFLMAEMKETLSEMEGIYEEERS